MTTGTISVVPSRIDPVADQRREGCWTLAHLFIMPSRQAHGIGGRLLHRLHAMGEDLPIGLIGSTADLRAIRPYASRPAWDVRDRCSFGVWIHHRCAISRTGRSVSTTVTGSMAP